MINLRFQCDVQTHLHLAITLPFVMFASAHKLAVTYWIVLLRMCQGRAVRLGWHLMGKHKLKTAVWHALCVPGCWLAAGSLCQVQGLQEH